MSVPIPESIGTASVPPRRGEEAARPSITDFITDGSLAGLCEELTRLTGVRVCLRDPQGRAIVRMAEAPYWRYDDAVPGPSPDEVIMPLGSEGRPIGALVLAPGSPHLAEHGARGSLERALAFLAAAGGELVRQQIDLKHRVKEV